MSARDCGEEFEVCERVYPHHLVGAAGCDDREGGVRGCQPCSLEGGWCEIGEEGERWLGHCVGFGARQEEFAPVQASR